MIGPVVEMELFKTVFFNIGILNIGVKYSFFGLEKQTIVSHYSKTKKIYQDISI